MVGTLKPVTSLITCSCICLQDLLFRISYIFFPPTFSGLKAPVPPPRIHVPSGSSRFSILGLGQRSRLIFWCSNLGEGEARSLNNAKHLPRRTRADEAAPGYHFETAALRYTLYTIEFTFYLHIAPVFSKEPIIKCKDKKRNSCMNQNTENKRRERSSFECSRLRDKEFFWTTGRYNLK